MITLNVVNMRSLLINKIMDVDVAQYDDLDEIITVYDVARQAAWL